MSANEIVESGLSESRISSKIELTLTTQNGHSDKLSEKPTHLTKQPFGVPTGWQARESSTKVVVSFCQGLGWIELTKYFSIYATLISGLSDLLKVISLA